ncbi:alpha/beta hydrolase domain-containing protein [Actinocorallia aurea]
MRVTERLTGRPGLISTFFDLGEQGYTADEYVVSGTAAKYEHAGPAEADGMWTARETGEAPYTTRIVVYRPADPSVFDGTVVVEWLNTSSGADTPAVWLTAHRHLLRSGHAWVGVSAQADGIHGGSLFASRSGAFKSITLPPLKESDPERYAALVHPGNPYSYAIYTALGALLREKDTAEELGLPGVRVLLAAGQSQSAACLVTYLNAVAPLRPVYDGYYLHGRPGLPSGLSTGSRVEPEPVPARVRTDGPARIVIVQSETDVFGYLDSVRSRQPHDGRLRVWEVAGAAHADTYTLSASFRDSGALAPAELAALLAPTDAPLGTRLPAPINSGPQQHYVAQAALASLRRWTLDGIPPGSPMPLGTLRAPDGALSLRTDDDGIARGGVRTPWVDSPTALLTGLPHTKEHGPALLFGGTHPLPGLAARYPGGLPDYLARFEAAVLRSLEDGFLLEADYTEAMTLAEAAYPR